MDRNPAFSAVTSFDLPLVIGVLGPLPCCSGDCVDSTAAPVSRVLDTSLCFPSCSNGDPFRIDPNGDVSLSRASPPETAVTSFGSAGSISAVSSSAVDFGLSGLAVEGAPSIIPDFFRGVLSFFLGGSLGVVCLGVLSSFLVDF